MAPSSRSIGGCRPWNWSLILVLCYRSLTAASPAATAPAAPAVSPVVCTEKFTPITAGDYVAAMEPGWNLGNTLDAIPTEGSWNNAPVVSSTFDDIKAAGFKSVRIPVTYTHHFVGSAPEWTVNATWLQRVSDVVDMALEKGLYVLTNVHHDSWDWADVTKSSNLTALEERFYKLWLQIGQTLACKSSMLSLEPINEPPSNTEADAAEINKLNEIFLKALADSGGFNSQRVVTLVGPNMDGGKTSQYFKAPKNVTNPWALQFHYYSPYPFIFSAWGSTIWGSEADRMALATDLMVVRSNFTDIPIIIGEYSASQINTEPAARWKWVDAFTTTAKSLGMVTMLWDNGADNLDRPAHKWRDPVSVNIIMNALKLVANSLPDSTTDPQATSQWSSAYIFHKVGEPVISQKLPLLLNHNTLVSVTGSDGKVLEVGSDYTVSGSNVTFTAAFLSRFLSATAEPGIKSTLTLTFSAGSPFTIDIVQWDTPELASNSSVAKTGSDLRIPVTYKGLKKVAAVKIVADGGVYVFDDWTQYLGPLQQGRGTYNNQWNFDDGNLIIAAAAVQAVASSGKATTFTFEFYPRVLGNSVDYKLMP